MSVSVSLITITSCVNNPPDQSLAIETVGFGGSDGGVWGGGGDVGGLSGGGNNGGGVDGGGADGGINGGGVEGGGVEGGGVEGGGVEGGVEGGGRLGDPCASSHGVAASPNSVTMSQWLVVERDSGSSSVKYEYM